MWLNRKCLFTDVSVIRAYGSIYKVFRRPVSAMPLALLGKKLAIACCSLFLSRVQSWQIVGFLVLIAAGGSVQVHMRGYYFPMYDRLELVLTVLLSVILACGMLTAYSSKAGESAHEPAVLISVVVIVCIIALLLASALS